VCVSGEGARVKNDERDTSGPVEAHIGGVLRSIALGS
jgi:hypothetical protein